ncbi:hypothetical protein [Salinactinospora qingdaonensis]|uniref:Uncharacterized protein n=1 Tax=Salinactinospora qingdaonensis TaxID=702744 RepID=A0ABP7FKJ6_9ACTN
MFDVSLLDEFYDGTSSGEEKFDWTHLKFPDGKMFPSDYRALVDRFGCFVVDDHIIVSDPEPILKNMRINDPHHRAMEPNHVGIFNGKGEHGYYVDAEEVIKISDLIQWGDEDSDFALFWNAVGDPDHWNVVVTDYYEFWAYRMGVAEFIYSLFDGSVQCEAFEQNGWPHENMKLVPIDVWGSPYP